LITYYMAYDRTRNPFRIRDTQEQALADLASKYDVSALVEDRGILFDADQHIGVGVITV